MTQKELKTVYTEELRKAWNNDEKMVNHCIKSTAYVIEHNGALYGIEKPKIETYFCFGYGMYGVSTYDEEYEADKMASHAKESKEYFITNNLKDINRWIEQLQNILEDMGRNWAEGSCPRYMIATGAHYCGQPKNCRLNYYSIVDTFRERNQSKICNDVEFIQKLIQGYEEVKAEFIKRLNAYLKRYGMSKIKTWSYLAD